MKLCLRLLIVTTIWFSTGPLHATIMTPLSIEQLTHKAELVLHGTVESKTCLKDSQGNIITKLGFKATEVWKGNLTTNYFTIIHGGGTVDGLTTVVDGQAEYAIGEEIVVYLRLNERGEGVSIGLAQGKFHVWQNDQTKAKFTHNLFHGQPKNTESPAAAQLRAAAGKPRRLGLQELHDRTRGGSR
jgi:hypothetical protein